MDIYGRDTLSVDALWALYQTIQAHPNIWRVESFPQEATACDFKRVKQRSDYFGFSYAGNTTGQAVVAGEWIAEIRLFIGNEPKDLSEAAFKRDRPKLRTLEADYRKRFEQELGAPRLTSGNHIHENNDLRVRLLPGQAPAWVVLSSLEVVAKLPQDHFASR